MRLEQTLTLEQGAKPNFGMNTSRVLHFWPAQHGSSCSTEHDSLWRLGYRREQNHRSTVRSTASLARQSLGTLILAWASPAQAPKSSFCRALNVLPALWSGNLSLQVYLLTGFSSGLPLGTSTTLRSVSTRTLALVTNWMTDELSWEVQRGRIRFKGGGGITINTPKTPSNICQNNKHI